MTVVATLSKNPNTETITIFGDLDWKTAPLLMKEVEGKLVGGRLVVDLRQVGRVDSAGTGALIDSWLRCQQVGTGFAILTTDPAVREILHTVRLSETASVLADDAALQAWLSEDVTGG